MYADYYFYVNEFYGKAIDAESFPHLSLLASQYVDYITFNRARKYTADDSVKMACCAIAECFLSAESSKSGEPEKKSESVGSWSASYYSSAELSAMNEGQIKAIAQRYLLNTGLLYRGRF